MCFDRMEFTRILRLHGLRPKNERRISMKKHPLLRTALLVMTAAALLGVDSCPIEGFRKADLEDVLAREDLLDTARWGVACMVAFGYRVREPRAKTRRPEEAVVRWVQ